MPSFVLLSISLSDNLLIFIVKSDLILVKKSEIFLHEDIKKTRLKKNKNETTNYKVQEVGFTKGLINCLTILK